MRNVIAVLLLVAACGGDDGDNQNEEEVITTVILDFTPLSGPPVSFEFDDPDGDGGAPPTVDTIALAPSAMFALAVRFENRLEMPAEDITVEIADESDAHLVLFTGDAVIGPATTNQIGPLTHAYADTDINGLPIGLANTMMTASGSGTLTVTLLHMPPELPPVKSSDTVTTARDQGIDAIGGTTDVSVDFTVAIP